MLLAQKVKMEDEIDEVKHIIYLFYFKILYPGIQFSMNNCFTMYPATKNKNNLLHYNNCLNLYIYKVKNLLIKT